MIGQFTVIPDSNGVIDLMSGTHAIKLKVDPSPFGLRIAQAAASSETEQTPVNPNDIPEACIVAQRTAEGQIDTRLLFETLQRQIADPNKANPHTAIVHLPHLKITELQQLKDQILEVSPDLDVIFKLGGAAK